MDMYQDIVICSKYIYEIKEESASKEVQEKQVNEDSFMHLSSVHRKIIDSVH